MIAGSGAEGRGPTEGAWPDGGGVAGVGGKCWGQELAVGRGSSGQPRGGTHGGLRLAC